MSACNLIIRSHCGSLIHVPCMSAMHAMRLFLLGAIHQVDRYDAQYLRQHQRVHVHMIQFDVYVHGHVQ